jgi:iron complex outermembrane receptor protein
MRIREMGIVVFACWIIVAGSLSAGLRCLNAQESTTDTPGAARVESSNQETAPEEKPDETRKEGDESSTAESGKSGGKALQRHGSREVALEDVVVTATRKESLLKDAPASVTVIDAEELEKSALKSVDDVLRSVAGVDVWGSNLDPLGHRAVTVRGVGGGSSQERTLILVNGVPINDSWSGSIAWNQIPKEDVERIEVVRGPASSLYGTHAMGGVINIITKLPPEKQIGATVKGTYGELDTWSTYGSVAGRVCNGAYGYYLSGKKSATDGYLAVREEDLVSNVRKSDYDKDNLFGQFFWFIDPYSYLRFSTTHYREERNREFKLSRMDPLEINKADLTYRRDAPTGLDWLVLIYGHDEDQRHENDDRMTHTFVERITTYDKPFYGFTVQPSMSLTDWNILTAGFELKHSEATQEDDYEVADRFTKTHGKQAYFGVYAQDETFLFDGKLIIVPGVRYDWWKSYDGSSLDTAPRGIDPFDLEFQSESWESFNPKLGVVYHLTDKTTLRGAIGTGYRAPSPSELYANSTYGLVLVRGNPELDPEKVLSYELGAMHSFGKHFDLRVTVYQAIVDDLIDSRTVEVLPPPYPGASPFTIMQKDNIAQVKSRGVEVEGYYKIAKEWHGFINYTYNDSSIEEDDVNPDIVGNDLSDSPPNKVNIGLTYDNPRLFTGTLQARFVDESFEDNENTTELDSYWTLDLFLAKRFAKRFTISFDVENILDREYDIPSFNIYKAPGRLWAASLMVEF